MVTVLVFGPLLVTSGSVTAQHMPKAKMHGVVEVLDFEPGWPWPKLRVKTVCERWLIGYSAGDRDDREREHCKGCGLQRTVHITVIPSWRSVYSGLPVGMADEKTFVLSDWQTGARTVVADEED